VVGMRERAVSLGGTLNITSTSGLGTTVSLWVPGYAVYLHRPWLTRFWISNLRRQIAKYLTYKD
jgi:hypothetical protein